MYNSQLSGHADSDKKVKQFSCFDLLNVSWPHYMTGQKRQKSRVTSKNL